MEKFEIYLSVGTDPDFFVGDYQSAKQFLQERTSGTEEEIISSMMMSRLAEDEIVTEGDGWVVSITWVRG